MGIIEKIEKTMTNTKTKTKTDTKNVGECRTMSKIASDVCIHF